jgi:arabinan endo-1,5-alpha-L-arabinosidase
MEHDGVYWMYYAAEHDGGGMCIAVANSTKPEGPFVTSNTPLICNSDFRDIDPKQFVDPKTNHTYLFWGSDFAPIR